MAKKNNRLGDDPFDVLLPQIQNTRKKKDDDVNTANDDDGNVAKNKNDDTAKNINNGSGTDKNIVRNNSRNNAGNNDNNSVADKDNSIINDSANITSNVKSNVNAIVNDVDNVENVSTDDNNFINISKKQKKTDGYVRVSTYLLPDQVKAIEELQKKTGRDKGELYRMAVNILIERARVE
jgi:hypothetical protein